MTETIFDRFPKPPCAVLLGWELIEADAAAGRVRIRFQGRPEFLNPAGFVQGGILAAMLDDTMGPAALVASGGELYTATIDLQVSYLAPARPGPLIGEAQVVQLGKTIGFVEGTLTDAAGVMVARARTSARLVPTGRLAAA
jgi:uncharacterized protein (TIGR00369 family)